jgi:RNA polymerase sigma-70 factor (ECF subfamily)
MFDSTVAVMKRSLGLDPGIGDDVDPDDDVVMDRLGAEALYRAHAPFVVKFLFRLGAREQELEDLVQQVFLVAHHRGGYVRGSARPTTWLAAIAARVLSTHRRTIRRKKSNELLPDGEAALEDVAEQSADAHRQAEARESLARVWRALEKLTEDQRLLFILHEMEERSCESLASELELPLGTIHSRLHAARRAFTEAHRREMAVQPTKSGESKRGTP